MGEEKILREREEKRREKRIREREMTHFSYGY